ncbi:hypothetical protein DH2020_035801 [Rehmannia glutinosa]|uniref:Reverse transcriptase zinc-binding domain n=1 Tax=Rehmannia glutinosa TaxID=99300 RepID=A0ABR0V5G1_REHGL
MHHRPSWTWRSIMESMKVLLEGCVKRINSGANTRVWGDRWIPKAPYYLRSPAPSSHPQTMKVCDLIDTENNRWKVDLITHLFQENEANLILSIPLHNSDRIDTWYWAHSKNGKFSVKSAYHTILQSTSLFGDFNVVGNTSSGTSKVWKKLWNLAMPTRISHFAWRLLTDSLPTPYNLLRRHLQSDANCPLCHSTDISDTHIFFHCPLAQQVWYISGISELVYQFQQPSMSLWFRDLLEDSPNDIAEFSFTLCNGIWYGRNKYIFENQPFTPVSIVSLAGITLKSFQSAAFWPERPTHSLSDLELLRHPPRGTHIYFDGAVSIERNCAGIGVYIQDGQGGFIKGLSKNIPSITNPEMAEKLALREALLIAISEGLTNASFIGDSIAAITAARDQTSPEPDTDPISIDIWTIQKQLKTRSFFGVHEMKILLLMNLLGLLNFLM